MLFDQRLSSRETDSSEAVGFVIANERHGPPLLGPRRSILQPLLFVLIVAALVPCLTGCHGSKGDPSLTHNTYLELVDWHIAGLWVINCPVAWVRVANYNPVPIKNITFKYWTYDEVGHQVSDGTFTIEDNVAPGTVRNFIEQYLGIVDLHSDKLSIKLLHVDHGD